ncbi:MAG: hypothetical protein AAF738_09970 [Bacteroidota bacterium]
MLQKFRVHIQFFLGLLLVSYSWGILKMPVAELFYEIAYTAKVVNVQISSYHTQYKHEHQQERTAADLAQWKADLQEEKEEQQQNVIPDLDTQHKIINAFELVDDLKVGSPKSRFYYYFTYLGSYLTVQAPPPQYRF